MALVGVRETEAGSDGLVDVDDVVLGRPGEGAAGQSAVGPRPEGAVLEEESVEAGAAGSAVHPDQSRG